MGVPTEPFGLIVMAERYIYRRNLRKSASIVTSSVVNKALSFLIARQRYARLRAAHAANKASRLQKRVWAGLATRARARVSRSHEDARSLRGRRLFLGVYPGFSFFFFALMPAVANAPTLS